MDERILAAKLIELALRDLETAQPRNEEGFDLTEIKNRLSIYDFDISDTDLKTAMGTARNFGFAYSLRDDDHYKSVVGPGPSRKSLPVTTMPYRLDLLKRVKERNLARQQLNKN